MAKEAPAGRGWRCAADGRRFASETELQQTARGIINKLTHPVFDNMVEQMSDLVAERLQKMCDEGAMQELDDIADILYNISIEADSPRDKQLLILYARFSFAVCVRTAEPGKLGASPFRRKIVTKSQRDFETFQQQLADGGHPDPAVLRRLSAGNVNFIAQLFNQKLITDKVLLVVARTLSGEVGPESRPPIEDNLELLFELLRAAGEGIDVEANRETCDVLFATLLAFESDESLSRRCRYRVKDILELRERGWKERRRGA
eukprot:Hpha_TRINITY_DN13531_c0_g1::TRINITY_DN13531_c0_g1_i1::g.111483::m.111483/K03260/EIF4G; translation initiation factor 4G